MSMHELLALWHNQRRSILTSRQHLVNEAEHLLCSCRSSCASSCPTASAVRPRLAALQLATAAGAMTARPRSAQLLDDYRTQIARLDAQESRSRAPRRARESHTARPSASCAASRPCSVAELLVEVGDPRRFTIGGFARFNASAPLAASTAEGPGEPVRHRYNPGGNRRVNATLHLMAITQLRCEPRAQALYENARKRGHTKKEARRILKRHLSDVIYRRMIRDLAEHAADQPLLAA